MHLQLDEQIIESNEGGCKEGSGKTRNPTPDHAKGFKPIDNRKP